METLQIVIGLGVAIVSVGIAGTTLVMTTLHRWKGDICDDITSLKKESQLSYEELKEYLETKEKILRELGERLARIEGRTIERDTAGK